MKTEKEELEKLYADMYAAMIAKDTVSLGKILDNDFILVHMTGMRQPKKEYLQAIANGTLNYFSCDDTDLEIEIKGDKAFIIGKSKVNAAVFGGGRHTWRLRLDLDMTRKEGKWLISEIRASTY